MECCAAGFGELVRMGGGDADEDMDHLVSVSG